MKVLTYVLNKYYGLKEIIGNEYSPTILNWIKKYFPETKDDEDVPYCSIALIEVYKELSLSHLIEKATPAAISWASIGIEIPLNEALLGDVVVLKRIGGNHVGLFVRYSKIKNVIYLLGFNQNNSCNITEFPISTLKNIRRV